VLDSVYSVKANLQQQLLQKDMCTISLLAALRYTVCALLLSALLEQKSSVAAAEDDARRQRLAIDGQEFAICMIVKDQNRDIREWVHYHRSMG
jgi:hypothetical protein